MLTGVLTKQCAVFEAMLRVEGGLRESREDRVEITDLSPGVVRALLHWLYTDRIPIFVQAEVAPFPLKEDGGTGKTG